jgi:hypothetical protein
MEERIAVFQQVRQALKPVHKNSCLTQKEFDIDSQLSIGYTIDDIVDLEIQIGTPSKYGVIYKASVRNLSANTLLPMAAKLMPNDSDNKKEVELNVAISYHILKPQISRHFLLCYKSFHCRKLSTRLPSKIHATDYYVTLNELASGDVHSLCIKKNNFGSFSYNTSFLNDSPLLLNIIYQCLLSIATFHKMGWVHQDCHLGNFLYHKTTDTQGYYHYVILGKDYYLKNCGYTMMIYDFGHAQPYTFSEPYYYHFYDEKFDESPPSRSHKSRKFLYDYYDYRNMLDQFCYPGRFSHYIQSSTKAHLIAISDLTAPNKYRSEDKLIKDMLKLMTSSGIMHESLADNKTIINAGKPYIIDDSLKTKMPKDIYHKASKKSFASAPMPSSLSINTPDFFNSVPIQFTPKSSPRSFPKSAPKT